MITTILIITNITLLIFSTLLFIRGYYLVKRMEILEDIIIRYDVREDETKKVLNLMLQQMRDIDIKGSFEADDEVGVVFTELKNLIDIYNNL
jgi:hypothetical protein